MRALLASLIALLLTAPAAAADTIVFRRGTDVWRMDPDGRGQRALTHGDHRYEWPSAADDGVVVALDEAGRLHRFSPAGTSLGEPIPTAATGATEDTPAETPMRVRISPDGSKIAYDEVIDGEITTLWTPATATGLEFPGQAHGQAGFVAPSWIGNGLLALSRDVTSEAPAPVALYAVGGGDGSHQPWFGEDGATWATGFVAATSRAGTRIAVLEDDAADQNGTPSRVVLRLFVATAPGGAASFRCELPLEAADTYASTSPTFSPDGARVAWAQSDGIHVAALGALEGCGAIRGRVVTLPGAWEPHWSPADEPPPRAGAPVGAKLSLHVQTRARPYRCTLRRHGVRVRVTVSAPATVRLWVKVGGTKRYLGSVSRKLVNAGTTSVRVRLRSVGAARRLVLRASAPGATAVERSIRPRAAARVAVVGPRGAATVAAASPRAATVSEPARRAG